MRIAILDDDLSFLELITSLLSNAGHTCDGFAKGKEMQRILLRESYDLLILDWHVPDLSGMEILSWARANLAPTLPILFTTSRSAESDIVEGLTRGADDYIVKPIREKELLGRVKALLRRSYPVNLQGHLEFGRYVFEPRKASVRIDQQEIELTPKEYDLALLLFRNLGRPISRTHITDTLWTRMVDAPIRSLDTHLSRVRSKLQLVPDNGFRLMPVYGFGYRLESLAENDDSTDSMLRA
jgi:DNA-binding response OmpR family regulator